MVPGIMVTIVFSLSIGLTSLMFVLEKKDGLLDRSGIAGKFNERFKILLSKTKYFLYRCHDSRNNDCSCACQAYSFNSSNSNINWHCRIYIQCKYFEKIILKPRNYNLVLYR